MARFRRFFFLLVFLLAACPLAFGRDKSATAAVEGFKPGSYRSASGETMQYRLFVPPGYDPAQKYPIVLWLHGAAGRGSDNVSQLSGRDFSRAPTSDHSEAL